ncbi:MAG: response regulator [Desulfobacteraceae bacterium]|nr:response regulator [Desulfobacteraceae bacterium]
MTIGFQAKIKIAVEKQAYEVCGPVPSGEEAVEKAESERPDLVLMDIVLKGPMYGIEAARQIRSRFGIPVIYVTAFSGREILDRAKITVPFGYLIKPFEDRELYANIEMALFKDRIEQELLKSKKLESVGILAGGLAHDFNNLLSVILGNINMAKEDISKWHTSYEFLNEAEDASLRAKDLTHQLITLSKGGYPIKRTGSVEKLLRESVLLFTSGYDVSCEFNIQKDLWLADYDEIQMKHVINNIITNANQAMPEGGIIQTDAENYLNDKKNEQVLPLQKEKYVKISIRDQGVGIPEKFLPLVFDPYFSTRQRGTRKGMGLGLATVYSIIKKHNGQIGVESELNAGTVFHIYLPASEKKTEEHKVTQVKTGPLKGKILVMDDEEMIRKLLKKTLKRLGCESELAGNSEEAIHFFKKAEESGEPFDAVILDLTIKEGIGDKDVIWKLKEINPDVKAVISSGYSNDPVMANFRKYGFAEAMPKPCLKRELSDILNRILEVKGERL